MTSTFVIVQNKSPAQKETENFDIGEFLRFASREHIPENTDNAIMLVGNAI